MSLAAALFVIQIRSAVGAQPPAIAAANHFHRQRQQYLLSQHVRQKQSFALEKTDFRVVILQPRFFRPLTLRYRAVEEVERPVNLIYHRFHASSAHQLYLGFNLARDPDLTFQQLRGRIYFKGLHLLHLPCLVVDASRSVALPYQLLADGKDLDVKEHLFSASGAYAHVFSLLSRLPDKSRKVGPASNRFAP